MGRINRLIEFWAEGRRGRIDDISMLAGKPQRGLRIQFYATEKTSRSALHFSERHPDTIPMHVETLGEGSPAYTIVACVHGDETCGWHAFNRLKASDVVVREPVKFVLANERAFKLGFRFCDADLNRVTPGDASSAKHEERLAARLYRELQGTTVIDFHSTESKGCPYAIVTGGDDASLQLARSTGLDRVVDMSLYNGGVTQDVTGVAVECGYYDDEDAATMAHRILLHFLAAEGIIDYEYTRSTPTLYEVFGEAEGRGYTFVAENFRQVAEGEVFATKNGVDRRAKHDFYPVLMSTHGYTDRIGFKARRLGPIPSSREGPPSAG